MKFNAKILAFLSFTKEEVEYMAMCAEHHYDFTVQSLVPPGEGAIINGMRNRLLCSEQSTESDYTFRQIDLLHKAIEFTDDPIGASLKNRFSEACKKINKIQQAFHDMVEAMCE